MKLEDHSYAPPRRVALRNGRAITLRLLEATDLPQMIDFYRDVTPKDGVFYRGTAETMIADAAKWVPATANNPCMVCLVLVADDGSIHGEAWYQWKADKPQIGTFGICIRPTMQGQGAGRLIMTRLMEIGDTYGPPRINLTVQFENMRAWKLYTSLGFQPLYEQMRPARADCPPMLEFYMERTMGTAPQPQQTALRIGWGAADITPSQPAFIAGQFHARLPEEAGDPLTVTALILDNGEECVTFVSCDLACVFEEVEHRVRARIITAIPELKQGAVILNATHTHTAPSMGGRRDFMPSDVRKQLAPEVLDPEAYRDFVADRITAAVTAAWNTRTPGKVAWGLDFAVVGRNRRWVDGDGKSTMYGDIAVPHFSHIEGYEDHSVNVLATYDTSGTLTGVVVNVPCPSQVSEQEYRFSADYWHDTRQALRQRFGDALFVLPQCSTAGDQSPRPFYDKAALQRMERLRGQNSRQAIATRLARAVADTVAAITPEAVANPQLKSASRVVNLPLNRLTSRDAEEARVAASKLDAQRDAELKRLTENPDLLKEPRWYVALTRAVRLAAWHRNVVTRYEQMKEKPDAAQTVALRAVRVGDVAFACNPFEYYLDYGIMLKARSPFLQTFLIQLAGDGTYVPSVRSTAGGGYGSIPASNPIGPEGGRLLAEESLVLLGSLYDPAKENS